MLIGQTFVQFIHFSHLSLFKVIAPPNNSTALLLQALRQGAVDGWQCIQNNVGVSTDCVC